MVPRRSLGDGSDIFTKEGRCSGKSGWPSCVYIFVTYVIQDVTVSYKHTTVFNIFIWYHEPFSLKQVDPLFLPSAIAQTSDSVTNSNSPTSPLETNLIAINANAQLPYKLTSSNFPAWHAQLDSLIIGFDLQGFINGSNPCPTLGSSPTAEVLTARNRWIRQDKLLLNGIFASVSESIMPLIATSSRSREAWLKLTQLYANRSRTRVMQLKDTLTSLNRGAKSVTDYLQQVKSTADELALVDSPLTNDDLTLYILNGLGSEYRDIAGSIHTRENPLTFEELHDLLVSHETYLHRLETLQQTTC
ncbi:hypothetical protein F2P56_012822 [Juglans regia]|uniref:Retrovirus-related Pol polyprotein from transposon RE1 n=1 Tax=Juglans regia TaxID=51240 RepID=A0A834CUY9_JUGRE|nr:hypothetical protein F2P56_012822 [Juglans regia]